MRILSKKLTSWSKKEDFWGVIKRLCGGLSVDLFRWSRETIEQFFSTSMLTIGLMLTPFGKFLVWMDQ